MKEEIIIKELEKSTVDKYSGDSTFTESVIMTWYARAEVRNARYKADGIRSRGRFVEDGGLVTESDMRLIGVKTFLIKTGMIFDYDNKRYKIDTVSNNNPRHTIITGMEL